jgi:cell division protein FtsN
MRRQKALIISIIITGMLFGLSCKKNKEQVEKLAAETQEAEATTSRLDSSQMTPAATQDSTLAQAQEYGAQPEKTPDAVPEVEKRTNESQKPAAMPPRIAEGYTVQIGSSTSRAYAEKVAGQFTGRGYQAYISEAEVEGVPHYRIRIGSFETLAAARTMGEELASKYGVSYWIDKNLK